MFYVNMNPGGRFYFSIYMIGIALINSYISFQFHRKNNPARITKKITEMLFTKFQRKSYPKFS